MARPGMPSAQGILVTGLPRSGTSWIGKMLEASGEVVYINEPMNMWHPPGLSPGVLNTKVSTRYEYICADNDERWAVAFNDTLGLRYHLIAELRRNRSPYDLAVAWHYLKVFNVGRFRNRHALIDDPWAIMSVAWFAQRLGCPVVVSVRHPLSFVGSWRRLGWNAQLHDLLEQPLLMRDLLGPYEEELRAMADSTDAIAKAALLWRVTYAAIGDLNERKPGLMHIQRYEDLARDPEPGFRKLYEICGLTWSERARKRIAWATTDHGKAKAERTWNGVFSRTAFRPMDSRSSLGSFRDRLSQQEIDQVREITGTVADQYYDAEDGATHV
jgi:Sulfotransferase family